MRREIAACLLLLQRVEAKTRMIPLIPHHVVHARRERELGYSEAHIPRRVEDDTANEPKSKLYHHQQIEALYQGYGTHYVDLWVGTPPQRQTVIVDTGSGNTAFPCSGCSDCGESYHTDGYFTEGSSSTFQELGCDDCFRGHCSNKQCTISMSYQEGSSWTAYEAKDIVYAGGYHDKAVELGSEDNDTVSGDQPDEASAFKFEMTFGCQIRLTGLFRTQLADGIMGMDNAAGSFWSQMYSANVVDSKKFSLCFNRQPLASRSGTEAGAMTLGGVDPRLHLTPMVYAKNLQEIGFYTVHLRKVYLREGGGESVVPPSSDMNLVALPVDEDTLNSGSVIVDSGTTDTYMTRKLSEPFKNAWKQMTGLDYDNEPMTLTDYELHQLPTIIFQLAPADVMGDETYDVNNPDSVTGKAGNALDPSNPDDILIAMPASHYMEYDPDTEKYTPRLYLGESSGSVLGANLMQGHDVLIDIDNLRVGFAESLCDYHGMLSGNTIATDLAEIIMGGSKEGTCNGLGCRLIVLGAFGCIVAGALFGYKSYKNRGPKYGEVNETELSRIDQQDDLPEIS